MPVFNMPKNVNIKARSSSITNSFFNGIVPVVKPSKEEIRVALTVLEQKEDDVRCVYCGDKKTEWDHLHPLIVDKEHTGYITEIANLVPACSKCNQSKGNSDWKKWMLSDADLSPKTRGIKDLDKRIKIIENYDKHFKKQRINLEEIAGKKLWEKYQKAYCSVIFNMEAAQEIMDDIKLKMMDSTNAQKPIDTNNKVNKNSVPKTSNSKNSLVSVPAIDFYINNQPVSPDDFKDKLLQVKQCSRIWFYSNGTQKNEIWDATSFTKKSNLMSNIKTNSTYRKWKEKGITKVEFRI